MRFREVEICSNLGLCLEPGKYKNSEKNGEEKWKERKTGGKFKLKILILYVYINSFYLFISII